MKKIKVLLSAILLFYIISIPCLSHAAVVSIMNWSLMDSGKHLDWDGSTAYQSQFNSAVSVWNAYKSGVIRQDTIYYIEDVVISDFYEVSNVAGETNSLGTIRFNTYVMGNYSTTKKQHVCEHELGHALGLDENQTNDVMDPIVNTIIILSVNDKASYDASYNR